MYSHKCQLRVKYGETDRMGYVYYGNYPLYFEVGRVEALRDLGLSYKQMEDELNIFMPVMSLQVRYLRPCFYDELLTLETTVFKIPETTIQFETKIYKENNKLANQGLITLCFVNKIDNARVSAPDIIVQSLKTHFVQNAS